MRVIAVIGMSALVLAVSMVGAMAQTASGTVTKIDEAQGKITINHGPIKNLDMEGMTMVFRVSDPSMLKMVKTGDKVKFDADRVNGAITVTKIQKSK